MISAVAYLRMSKEIQDTSIPAQRNAIAELAKTGGYRILREYIDSGISGDATEKRVEFQRMIADAAAGAFRVVLCWDQDRFGRFDLLEAGHWIKPLRDAGVQLVTVAQGKIDWNDFAGRLVYSIQQEGKHQFLRDLSRNSTRGKMEAAKAGKWMGGSAPYGYEIGPDKFLVVVPEEARIVREIFTEYGRGVSMRQIILSLTRRGVPSPDGVRWNPQGIGRIVRNRVYLGHIIFNKKSTGKYNSIVNGTVVAKPTPKPVVHDQSLWMTVPDAHEPIVTQEEYDAAQRTLTTNKKFSGPPTTFRVMFRSLLRCGWCGGRMGGYYVPRLNDTAYFCASNSNHQDCTSNRTYQKPLWRLVQEALSKQHLTAAGVKRIASELLAEFEAAKSGISMKTLLSRKKTLSAKLAKLKIRLAEVPVDMVPIIADQIRDVESQLARVDEQIEIASRPQRDVKSEVAAWIQNRLKLYHAITAFTDDSPSLEKAQLLQDVFDKIHVWSSNPGAFFNANGKWQPNGRWQIDKIEVFVKTPDLSQ